jgi:leader peptidase (prepilin peptidase)/N-methyltransferase
LLTILCVLFATGVLFALATPLLLEWIANRDSVSAAQRRQWFEWVEATHHWLLILLVSVWVFAFGSSIASFLNVVAYRWPRGGSILGRSHCPRCQQQLSMWENMPIFGWLRNGGRCAHCRLPISARYLFVELILGAGFLIAFWAELFPLADSAFARTLGDPAAWIMVHLAEFVVMAAMLSAIFVAGLLQWERTKIPASLIAALWIVCIIAAVLRWWIQASHGQSEGSHAFASGAVLGSERWLMRLAAMLTAFVIGAVLPLESESNQQNRSGIDVREMLMFALIGLALPWRMTVIACLAAAGILLIAIVVRSVRKLPFACVYLGILVALGGHWLLSQSLTADHTSPLQFQDIGLAAAALIVGLATRILSQMWGTVTRY